MADKPIYTITYTPAGNQPQHAATWTSRVGQAITLKAGETSKPRFLRPGDIEMFSAAPGLVLEHVKPPEPPRPAAKPKKADRRGGK